MFDRDNYLGQQIGNYLVVEKLGSGQFGTVYRAQNKLVAERIVAIKLINNKYVNSQQECERFLQEARLLLRLRHPHILPVIDIGEHQDTPYMITEFAPMGSLRHYMTRLSPNQLPLQQVLAILSQVGQALHYAHQNAIVHRDLKPENILFNVKEEALLADFGIAIEMPATTVKNDAIVIGTPSYMAPEQFEGTVSKLSDQYALGCIAYELVTGQRPFQAHDFFAIAVMHAKETPIPPRQLNPSLPIHIEQAILKAMAKERIQRHADVAAFIAAFGTPSSVTLTPPPPPPGPDLVSPTPTFVTTVLKGPSGPTLLGPTEVTIGRAAGNTYMVNDPLISSYHAVIRPNGPDFTIFDLNSRNKTFVNEQIITPQVGHALKQGDKIRVGNSTFEYMHDVSNYSTAVGISGVLSDRDKQQGTQSRLEQFVLPRNLQEKKPTRLWITLAVISAIILAAVTGGLVVATQHGLTPTPTPTPAPTLAPAPTPTPTTSLPPLSGSYSGTITASNGVGSTMDLYSIQEYTDGTIKGFIHVNDNGSFLFYGTTGFSGSVYPNDSLNFTMLLTNGTAINFKGTINTSNNTMQGTYSGSDQESGSWSISSS